MDVKKDRFEFKHLVPIEDLARLRRALAPFVEMDPHVRKESGAYTVHSIYFDTCSLDYYHQKMAGIQHRKKVRVRGYNEREDGSPVFLEIKRKNNMAISKNRAWLRHGDLEELFASGDIDQYIRETTGDPGDRENARRFFYHMYRYALRPVVLIHYEREAFFQKVNSSVRLTLDKNLRSSPFPALPDLFTERRMVDSLSGYFVFEVKFRQGIPWWLRTILDDFGLERTSVSKYTICLDEQGIPENASRGATLARSGKGRAGERFPGAARAPLPALSRKGTR